MEKAGLQPMLRAVRARIIQLQTHPAGSLLGIGYGAPVELQRDMRLAVLPVGFWDGLNHVPPLGHVIVAGRLAPVIGRRSFQHTVIDVSDIPAVLVGATATIVGRQDGLEIGIDDLAATMGLPVMEVLPRLVRALPHLAVA